MKFITLFILMFISILALTLVLWFEPSDYDGCILAHMPGVASDIAAGEIIQSCKKKHLEKPSPRKIMMLEKERMQLPQTLLNTLESKGSLITESPFFKGDFKNNSKNWAIDQIEITIYPVKEEWKNTLTRKCKTRSISKKDHRITDGPGVYIVENGVYIMPGRSRQVYGCILAGGLNDSGLVEDVEYKWFVSKAWGINLKN